MPNVLMGIIAIAAMAYGFISTMIHGGGTCGTTKLVRPKHIERLAQPMHLPCLSQSPDGALHCRQEVGHGGWHSHHGPVSWYSNQWAEDDHDNRFGNVPWNATYDARWDEER